MDWRWQALGVDAEPGDLRVLKKAYAKALRKLDSENDADALQELNEAYEDLRDEIRSARHRQTERKLEDDEAVEAPEARALDNKEESKGHTEALSVPQPSNLRPEHRTINNNEERSSGLFGEPSNSVQAADFEYGDAEFSPTDWDEVNKWLESFDTSDEKLITRLQSLLNDPRMIDPNAASAAEEHLVQFFLDNLEDSESSEHFEDPEINRDVVDLLESRFRWFADFTSFDRRYPYASEVVYALGKILAQDSGDGEKWQFRWKDIRSIPRRIVLLLIVSFVISVLAGVLAMIVYEHIFSAPSRWVGKIVTALVFYLLVHFLVE